MKGRLHRGLIADLIVIANATAIKSAGEKGRKSSQGAVRFAAVRAEKRWAFFADGKTLVTGRRLQGGKGSGTERLHDDRTVVALGP
jgi:hypothetical protein